MRVFPHAGAASGPMSRTAAERTLRVMNHAEKRPLREPRPEHELTALLWVIAALLACLDVVWWLGEHMYS
jgi:hypothetical protein